MRQATFPALIFILFIAGCISSSNISTKNVAEIYRPESKKLHPQYIVYHDKDSSSLLYFKFFTKELLYKKEQQHDGRFLTKARLHYELYASYEKDALLDSASTVIMDFREDNNTQKKITGAVPVPVKQGKNYLLKVTLEDQHQHVSATNFIEVKKTSSFFRQNFFVQTEEQKPVFDSYFHAGEKVFVRHRDSIINKLYGSYYNRPFPLAAPPFSMTKSRSFHYRPDSTFTILQNDSNYFEILPLRKGFYHLQTDTSQKSGLTLFNFGKPFPEVKAPEQLIHPLRYITTKSEFEQLINSKDKKEALDKFWLNNAASPHRAKELIRHYYNRVQNANRFFSSYKEGWMTDRGMVYIIFGPPSAIYKTSYSENWTYGEEGNFMSLNFTFVKAKNPFTNNDYDLNRSPAYKIPWYKAVDSWRQGRVYVNQ